jgi:hypothetical protein
LLQGNYNCAVSILIKQYYQSKVIIINPDTLKPIDASFIEPSKLPYNGEQLEFLAKNLKITPQRVLDVLSVISVSSDDLVFFIVNKRLNNRERRLTKASIY